MFYVSDERQSAELDRPFETKTRILKGTCIYTGFFPKLSKTIHILNVQRT